MPSGGQMGGRRKRRPDERITRTGRMAAATRATGAATTAAGIPTTSASGGASIREWASDAEALRRQLQAGGVNPRELDEIMRDLQKFDNERIYVDPRGLEQLQAAAIDKLKKFEFGLRRKAESGNESLSLSGSDQVPEGFRQAIEEYYRSLARKPLKN